MTIVSPTDQIATLAAECLADARDEPRRAAELLRERVWAERELVIAAVPAVDDLVRRACREAVREAAGDRTTPEPRAAVPPGKRRKSPAAAAVSQAAPDRLAGYEFLAVSNARDMLDYEVSVGVPLRDADRDLLRKRAAALAEQATYCAALGGWFHRIAAKLRPYETVGEALDEADVRDLFRAATAATAATAPIVGGGAPSRATDRAALMGGR